MILFSAHLFILKYFILVNINQNIYVLKININFKIFLCLKKKDK